jgi:hypothetical protein
VEVVNEKVGMENKWRHYLSDDALEFRDAAHHLDLVVLLPRSGSIGIIDFVHAVPGL